MSDDTRDNRSGATSKWGPAEWRKHGGPLAGGLLVIASLLFAADYAVRGADSLASSVNRLCANHRAICFWHSPASSGRSGAVRDQFVGTIMHRGDVRGIDFSPDGTLIAIGGGNDHTALLWDARTGEQVRLFVGDSVVSSVAFSIDGTRFATDSSLFDVATGERIARLSGGYDVAFSPDGSVLATASGYEPSLGTKLFDQRTGALIRRISGEYASSLAFSHDGKLLATATGYLGQGVRLWNLASDKLVRTLEGPSGSAAFSRDGRYVATAGNGTVRLFRPTTGEHLRDINGYVVAFSPDGRMLATVGEDRRVRLHDPANGNPIRTLDVYADKLVFSPDGKHIATVSPDKSIQVSRVP